METATEPAVTRPETLRGRKTRVALVGAGNIAETHLAVLRAIEEVEVAAVVDADRAKGAAFAQRHGIALAADSVGELLERARPDAAHVLVPPALHVEVAEPLLAAGVHVLVEKPMALHSSDARRLVESAAAGGARLGVNHNFTFFPLFRRMVEDVRRGRIGRLEHVISVTNNPLRQLAAGDVGNWIFREPRNIVFEQGPHPLSQVVTLAGEVAQADVVAGGRHDLAGARVFFDTWQATLRCEKATAQVFLGFGREFPESWIHAIGQDGSIRFDVLNGSYSIHEKTRWPDFQEVFLTERRDAAEHRRAAWRALLGSTLALLKLRPRSDAFYLGMKGSVEAFHAALRTGAPLPVAGEAGVAVVEACERITSGVAGEAFGAMAPAPPAEPRGARPGEVAVTGATGFLGGHLVEELLRRGKPVRILVRSPSVLPAHLADPRVRVVRGSLEDAAAVAKLVEGCDAVVHLASGGGASYADFERAVAGGSVAVAEACLRAKARRLIHVSTIAVYDLGRRGESVTEGTSLDARPEERSHYARAKIEAERRIEALRSERGLAAVVFRPAVVVGARGRALHTGVGLWPRDTHCVGWGRGENPIPFVLVEDVAAALATAVDAPGIDGQSFNLAGDVRLTAREYVEELRRATGRPIVFHPQPIPVTQALDVGKWAVKKAIRKPDNPFPSYRDLRSRSFAAELDCSRAKRTLGWKPVADRARFVERAIRGG